MSKRSQYVGLDVSLKETSIAVVDESDKTIPAPAPGSGPAVPRHAGLRHMVYQAFKENPSTPAAEVQGTIPQALLMMNSVLVHTRTAATGKTLLADLLAKGQTDEQIVAALYEQVLSRKDDMMLPGALKYGGLTALTALCAPGELYLHNTRGTGAARSTSSVPRSRSPAVTSMAG